MSYYLRQWLRFLGVWSLTALFTTTLLMLLVRDTMGKDISAEMMVYAVSSYPQRTLYLYDSNTGISAPLLHDIGYNSFKFSRDGRLAYSMPQMQDAEIYVIDVLAVDGEPINISQTTLTPDYPLGWSPDGRYLVFTSYLRTDDQQIFVWDGETVVNITPEMQAPAEQYSIAWSTDGRLAFTAWFSFSSLDLDGPSEIYLWDGHTTTNLSQNPTGEDREPTWNEEGQVAFLSARPDGYSIFVWDGVSLVNGAPDLSSFIQIAPTLTSYYSFPTWTVDGRVAFQSQIPPDTSAQVYVWDGQNATNISQNPNLHNGSETWSADGRWAFSTFWSSQQILYVRDAGNNNLWSYNGGHQSEWLANGSLAFCQRAEIGWILSVWDGFSVSTLVRGYEIDAQWQSGARLFCSSG